VTTLNPLEPFDMGQLNKLTTSQLLLTLVKFISRRAAADFSIGMGNKLTIMTLEKISHRKFYKTLIELYKFALK